MASHRFRSAVRVASASGALLLSCAAGLAQPANNACGSAILLSVSADSTATVLGTTVGSSRDGSGACGSSGNSPDVWYRFVVPAAGDVTVDTCGATGYDSVVVVRTACPGSGTDIGCDDDACGNLRSRVVLASRAAGEQLFIRVAGFSNAVGAFQLNVTHRTPQPPANDLCVNAQTVALGADSTTSVNGTNLLAGTEGGASCQAASADVWYRVTMPSAGTLSLNTCTSANFDTVMSVFTGCPGAGTELACSDDGAGCGNSGSRISLGSLASGQTVLVRIAGFGGAVGAFTLNVSHALPSVPPSPSVGPDVVTNVITDVANWGTDASGAITAFSVGTDSCNPGDYPVLWIDSSGYAPDYDSTQHPVISQNLYRLKSYGAYSRFEQLGQSWLKHGFLSTNSGACGTCGTTSIWRPSTQSYQGVGSDVLGVNCSDTYGAGLNGSQGGLGAKGIVNATVGTSPFIKGNGTGDAITKMRLQVPTTDVVSQPTGTRFFVDAFYVAADDAQFVRPGQTVAVNALNNASWREVMASSINSGPTFQGATVQQQPGIFAWRAADANVTLVTADHDDTPNPGTGWRDGAGNPSFPGTFIRSRFWVAGKATPLAGGLYRYEFAVYNHNSDRSAGRFELPLADSASVTDVTFRAPQYHSGEPWSNAPWTMSRESNKIVFSTQTFAANPNANAIRWGSLYNFGFTTSVAPVTGEATIGLFKPGFGAAPITSIAAAGLPVPPAPPACRADFNGDGVLDPDDLSDYIACYFTPPCAGADVNGDGVADPDDLSDFIGLYFAGC